MINPVNHAATPEGVATWCVESYVIAVDVYSLSPHIGRGSWSWYTGSAGWTYRLVMESLLGLRLEVDRLHLSPCVPAGWKSFKVHYRFREILYHIAFLQSPAGDLDPRGMTVTVDGVPQNDDAIPLVDDRRDHVVEVTIRTGGAGPLQGDPSPEAKR